MCVTEHWHLEHGIGFPISQRCGLLLITLLDAAYYNTQGQNCNTKETFINIWHEDGSRKNPPWMTFILSYTASWGTESSTCCLHHFYAGVPNFLTNSVICRTPATRGGWKLAHASSETRKASHEIFFAVSHGRVAHMEEKHYVSSSTYSTSQKFWTDLIHLFILFFF